MTLTATRKDTAAPKAQRSRQPGWRNPRLLLGLLLVAASVVVGARLMAAADDTVGVWAVARDLPAGATLESDDVQRRQVRFPDAATADGYLAASDDLPSAATLNRPVAAGGAGAHRRRGRRGSARLQQPRARVDPPGHRRGAVRPSRRARQGTGRDLPRTRRRRQEGLSDGRPGGRPARGGR